MNIKKTKIILFALLGLILIISFSLFSRNKKKKADTAPAYKIAKAYESEFTSNIDISGYLEAADVQKVQFRSTGAITGVFVKVGDKVKKGDLLATINDTQQRLNLIKAEQAIIKAKGTASEKEMEILELELQNAKKNIEYTKAISNFDGEVTEVNISVGDYSEAATTLNLMQIVDKSYLKAHVAVDEIDVKNLHEGMEINLNFESMPNENIKAVIHYIPYLGVFDSSSGIGVKNIEIRIYDPPEGIYPGYSFTSKIETKSDVKYLLVQSSALRSSRGKTYITKIDENNNRESVEVVVKYLGEGLSQVLFGDIKAGDSYIINQNKNSMKQNNMPGPF